MTETHTSNYGSHTMNTATVVYHILMLCLVVTEAILARFLVNADTYCLQFRSCQWETGESYKLLLSWQTDLLNHWIQSAGSELKEIVLLEQFLSSLPTELSVKLGRESPPQQMKQRGGLMTTTLLTGWQETQLGLLQYCSLD